MKKIIKNIVVAMAGIAMAAGIAACDDELAQAPIVMPDPAIGDGTWERPLQAWQAHLGTTVDGRTSNWVCGYIVGYIDTNSGNKKIIGTAGAVESNMLIAQYPYDEEDWAERGYTVDDCVPVQLVSGTATRTALNIAKNPNRLNTLVSLRGTTGSKYCGDYGVRQANDYNIGGIGRYEPPIEEIEGEYFCNFSASRDINFYKERGWATYMIKGGVDAWEYSESGGVSYLEASVSYDGSADGGPYENWLVTPAFDIDKAEVKTLSFRTRATTQADTSFEVYVMDRQNPMGCEPVKLECVIATAPTGTSSSAWTSSGTIDLSEFSGTIYIGFRYYSAHGGTGNASDFAVTDVNLGGADPEEWEVVDPASIHTYRRVTEIESGKSYLMVFDGNLMMLPITSGNYGDPEVKEVTFNEDGSITMKQENAFTIEAIPDSEDYMIIDANGKYYYMKGTYTNFNVALQPSDEYEWRFTADENGIFEIRNTKRNRVIVYGTSKGCIITESPSWYQGRGAALYKMEEPAANN